MTKSKSVNICTYLTSHEASLTVICALVPQHSTWYPVQREVLEISDTPSGLLDSNEPSSQPGAQPVDIPCSQDSAPAREGFVTAPQSPEAAPPRLVSAVQSPEAAPPSLEVAEAAEEEVVQTSEEVVPPSEAEDEDAPPSLRVSLPLDIPSSLEAAPQRVSSPPLELSPRIATRAVVTANSLPLVPFARVSQQPACRPFRVRCVLRAGGALAVDGELNGSALLIATCLNPECRTQYRGEALPSIHVKASMEMVQLCRRCDGELPLGLALPLLVCDPSGRGRPRYLQALAADEQAELLLAIAVRCSSLPAVRRRLNAVAPALRAGISGEVGLLPLPEERRRYMVVETVLTGVPEPE